VYHLIYLKSDKEGRRKRRKKEREKIKEKK